MPEDTLERTSSELTRVNTLVDTAIRKLNHINQQALAVERQIKIELAQRQDTIDGLEKRVRDLRVEIQEYEAAMAGARAADAARFDQLEAMEQQLRARERVLAVERQTYEQEKKRWRQTRELSRDDA